jgi:hypothetical protein
LWACPVDAGLNAAVINRSTSLMARSCGWALVHNALES